MQEWKARYAELLARYENGLKALPRRLEAEREVARSALARDVGRVRDWCWRAKKPDVVEQLTKVLDGHGYQPCAVAVGDAFDPLFHSSLALTVDADAEKLPLADTRVIIDVVHTHGLVATSSGVCLS